MKIWVLRNPKGKDVALFYTKSDAWFTSFDYQNEEHRHKFWKRPKASQKELQKNGWSVVSGKFVEDKK